MRTSGLVILSALAVPLFVFAVDANSTQTCDQYLESVREAHRGDQQTAASHTAIQKIPANTAPDKAPQLGHKESHDKVIANTDGSIMVTSICDENDKKGTIEICVYDSKSGESCKGVKIPKTKEDTVESVTRAITNKTGIESQKSLKDLAKDYKNKTAESTGALPSLNRSQVLDAFRKAGVRDPEGAIKDLQELGFGNEAEELLRAAARGDDRTMQEIIRKAESHKSSWPESFQRFKKNAFLEALNETREAARPATPDYFSALRTPSYTGFQGDTIRVMETGSVGDLANARGLVTVTGVASAYNPLTPGGWREGGRTTATGELYNPNEYSAAIQLSLAERFQMAHGKYPRVGYALVEYEDKQLVLKLNDNGPLVPGRIIDLNEASMRYLSGGRYDGHNGLLSNVKVTILDGAYPTGPVVNGKIIADAPKISTADLSYPNYWSSVSNRGSEPWRSPGTYNGNSGYNGSDGSPSSLGNLFSGFSGGPSSVAPPTSNAPTTTAPPISQPSSSNPPPSTTLPAIIHPAIAFSGAHEIDKGDSLLVVWAATGVSTTQTCILRQDGEAVAQGNSGTFFVPISAAYPDDSIIFTLECVPFDSRAPESEARKELKVLVR